MRVLLRADATPRQGTGHVMRCLTLAEALIARAHEVHLVTNASGIDWLEQIIRASSVIVHRSPANVVARDAIDVIAPDWVVVDSYEIAAAEISSLGHSYKVLAIIDGDDRGIDADLYLDHNLGAENSVWPSSVRERLLAGQTFALIRESILEQRQLAPWQTNGRPPHVVAVMGGSDPTGTIVAVAEAMVSLEVALSATVIVGDQWRMAVDRIVGQRPDIRVVAPTPDLPTILGRANVAVSASGTSAWELCTLAIPSLLLAVVDNQAGPLVPLVEGGLVLGLDLTKSEPMANGLTTGPQLANQLERLVRDEMLRKKLSSLCRDAFDGRGKQRVVDAMEAIKLR